MKIRSDVEYCEVNTLLGKKILVGIKEKNSYIQFDEKYVETIKQIVDNGKKKDVKEFCKESEKKKQIYNLFQHKGYLDGEIEVKESFNELKNFGRVLKSITCKQLNFLNKKIIRWIIFLIVILSAIFMILNLDILRKPIDYYSMSLIQILISIFIIPCAVLGLHEIGHCLAAYSIGVKVKKISIGLFITFPILAVTYSGLQLHKTRHKIWVELGGVCMNLFLATLGVLYSNYIGMSAVVQIWIIANVSTMITNMSFIGMTDGYFIVTSLIGVNNVRLLGYQCICKCISRKYSEISSKDRICGIVLLVSIGISFISLYTGISYLSLMFGVPIRISNYVQIFFVLIMFILFVSRLLKYKKVLDNNL